MVSVRVQSFSKCVCVRVCVRACVHAWEERQLLQQSDTSTGKRKVSRERRNSTEMRRQKLEVVFSVAKRLRRRKTLKNGKEEHWPCFFQHSVVDGKEEHKRKANTCTCDKFDAHNRSNEIGRGCRVWREASQIDRIKEIVSLTICGTEKTIS